MIGASLLADASQVSDIVVALVAVAKGAPGAEGTENNKKQDQFKIKKPHSDYSIAIYIKSKKKNRYYIDS